MEEILSEGSYTPLKKDPTWKMKRQLNEFLKDLSAISSFAYPLTKELAHILSPLVGKTEFFVNNSAHFVEKIGDLELRDSDIMVSFDVKSLFT